MKVELYKTRLKCCQCGFYFEFFVGGWDVVAHLVRHSKENEALEQGEAVGLSDSPSSNIHDIKREVG